MGLHGVMVMHGVMGLHEVMVMHKVMGLHGVMVLLQGVMVMHRSNECCMQGVMVIA